MTILGVIIQDNLSMGGHVAFVVSRGAQSLFRTLMSHGLSDTTLYCVCTAILVSRIIYTLPAWFCFTSEVDVGCIQYVLGMSA